MIMNFFKAHGIQLVYSSWVANADSKRAALVCSTTKAFAVCLILKSVMEYKLSH